MKAEEIRELLYQALETELGGVQVYTTALRCVVNDDLKKEWEEYLEQTQNHVRIVENVFSRLGLDTETDTPGGWSSGTLASRSSRPWTWPLAPASPRRRSSWPPSASSSRRPRTT